MKSRQLAVFLMILPLSDVRSAMFAWFDTIVGESARPQRCYAVLLGVPRCVRRAGSTKIGVRSTSTTLHTVAHVKTRMEMVKMLLLIAPHLQVVMLRDKRSLKDRKLDCQH